MVCDDEVLGLITVSGEDEIEDPALARLLAPVAEESALALFRLTALADEARRIEAMELANRLAGAAAAAGSDAENALSALRSALSQALRCDSVHLEWIEGDEVRLVVPASDPLFLGAPPRLPLARTRAADALDGRSLREPVAGRRPEDMVLATVGIRHVAVVPLTSGRRRGTLHVGRREPRAFSSGELSLLEMVAERLSLVLAATSGAPAAAATTRPALRVEA
jgi:GAF domain-containing protein